jgi:iron complex transport system permease protein
MLADLPVRTRFVVVIGVLAVGVLLACALAVGVGVEPIDWAAVTRPDSADHAIVLHARLGRALMGTVVGAALGAAGVAFQTLVRNPLADPYVLGVSSGASVGAGLAIAFAGGAGTALVGPAAFAGAMGATGLVYRLGLVQGRLVPYVALLAGVVLNAVSWALILAIATVAHVGTTAEVLLWLMGSLGPPSWPRLGLGAVAVAAGVIGLTALAPRLNALVLGDEGAHSVGVDVARTRQLLLVIASLLTAAAVALAGPIGFVGIIVPHVLRLVLGADHRLMLPAAALGGAIFLCLSDTLTRLAFLPLGAEPSVSVLTALMGGPFFLVLLWRRRGERLF